MFDKYVVGEGTVRNVTDGEAIIGFAFDSRISYYRGLGVSMVEPFEVRIDGGDPVPADQLRFTLNGRTWTFAELEEDYDTRWELTELATVTVLVAGGLTPGAHTLDVTECLRVSYLPMVARSGCTREVEIAA